MLGVRAFGPYSVAPGDCQTRFAEKMGKVFPHSVLAEIGDLCHKQLVDRDK
jgi:hypothetical protein